MNSPEYYTHKLNELGLTNIAFSISNIEEAKVAQKQAREAQKQLRQIKKDINLDIKELRAHYRQKSSGAGSGSSAALQILGKKKLAGQVRAEAKRNLRREKDSTIAPYERLKHSIDDLLSQLDNVKVQAQLFIKERKDEIASSLEELKTVHYQTPEAANEFIIPPKRFPVPKPNAPSLTYQIDQIEPTKPTKREGSVVTKLFRPLRQKLEDEYQERLQKYEMKLKDWEESNEQAKELYEKEVANYQARMVKWNEQKEEFDSKESLIIENIQAGEPGAIAHFITTKLNSLVFPLPVNISISVEEDLTIVIDVNYPLIMDWPLTQSDSAKRKDYVTHLHSITFRMIGEAFGYLPNVNIVKFSGYITKPSKRTGKLTKKYIFSTKIEQKMWAEINFNNIEWIDVVECFGEFETRRKITKTGIISEIVPL
ncbi:hypothetical protein [Candidatus Leptofilum sp.]|uniref:hypothetical protein n=1 Tax=Candidatus Leptofilum sp. TaxID=3241576 RepID=UPI003B5B5B43